MLERKKQYKLNDTKEIYSSALKIDWRFNDCVRVTYGGSEIFRVILSTFADCGKWNFTEDIATMAETLEQDGNEYATSCAFRIMMECNEYQAYEREIVSELRCKLKAEAGDFLMDIIRGLGDGQIHGLANCRGNHKDRWEWFMRNVIQVATVKYESRLYEEKFIITDYAMPACLQSEIESAFNRLCSQFMTE